MESNPPPLIFVYLGQLPEYVKYSLLLNSKYNKIILLTDGQTVDIDASINVLQISKFYNADSFNNLVDARARKFRGGFWFKTIERFFVLKSFMIHFNIDKIFHGELDNLVFSLANISRGLDEVGCGLFYPMLNEAIGGASLIYINSVEELSAMCKFFNSQQVFSDDMKLLADYQKQSLNIFILPSENSLNDEQSFKVDEQKLIFDLASFGQFIYGIDLRNCAKPVYNGFQNRHCTLDFSKLAFREDPNSKELYVITGNSEFKIVNLHVHSKIFKKLYHNVRFSTRLIARINQGKRTLISCNFRNFKFIRNVIGG